MSKRKVQNRTEILKGLSLPVLFKLIALQADANHAGAFSIRADGDGYKVIFGASVFDEKGRFETSARPSLKEALAAALNGEWAKSEAVADAAALVASR